MFHALIALTLMYTDTNPLKSSKLQMYMHQLNGVTKSLHFMTVIEKLLKLCYCPVDGLQSLPN